MGKLKGKTYGTRIAYLRTRNGVSVEQLAAYAGISVKRLELIENDERDVRLAEALKMAERLNEPIDNFTMRVVFQPKR